MLNLHHLPHTLTQLARRRHRLSAMRIRYSWEVPVLGSAGGPKRAIPLVANLAPDPVRIPNPGHFLIVNGDTLTDVDLARGRRGPSAHRARSSRWQSCPTRSRTSTAAWSSPRMARSLDSSGAGRMSRRVTSSACRWPRRRRSHRCRQTCPTKPSAPSTLLFCLAARVRSARIGPPGSSSTSARRPTISTRR